MAGRGSAFPPREARRPKNTRLTLKTIDNNRPKATRHQIFEMTHTRLNCFLTGITDTTDGYAVYSDLPATIDKLTSPDGRTALRDINLETVVPQHLRAKRTIFISGLDRHVGGRTADEIKDEITRNHNWITDLNIFKIKDYFHIIKVIFTDSLTADRVMTDGLTVFHSRISPTQCKKEQHTDLKICFNCYAYEDHYKNECPSRQVVCSECAKIGHNHRQCNSTDKRCLNCPSDNNFHPTLSPKCPVKRQAIHDKEQRLKDQTERQNNLTYSNIVKSTVKTTIKETTPTPRPTINLTDKSHLKIVALVIEAHVTAICDKRPYNEILSESLRLNFDIDVKIPHRESQKILDIYINPDKPSVDSTDSTEQDSDDMDTATSHPAPTPCPSPSKTGAKKKRRKTSPQEVPQQSKVIRHDRDPRLQKTQPPCPYSFRLFRSTKDTSKIPFTITPDWTRNELLKRPTYGLKIVISGDVDAFTKDLHELRFSPTHDQIRIIDDEAFQKHERMALLT